MNQVNQAKHQIFVYQTSKEAWNAMLSKIKAAQKSIYWESYIAVDDKEGAVFFDLLEEKSKKGVEIKIVFDSLGSWFGISKKRISSLQKSGIKVIFFNERKKKYRGLLKRLFIRTHRKILVIDEKIGFIGGVNLDARMKDWLDLHVEIHGKSVHSLLRSFAKMYIISGGDKKDVKHLIKYKKRVKSDLVEFLYDEQRKKKYSRARHAYMQALLKARERIIIFSPYYFPDKKMLIALWNAKKRGVRIDLLVPFRSDVRIATYVAYAIFSLLSKFGVNIHLTDKMMHGKGFVVDGNLAMVGSSNFEPSSLYNNYEANVKINDKKTVKIILTILDEWIIKSKKFEIKYWNKKNLTTRILQWTSLKIYMLWYEKDKDPHLDFFAKKLKIKKTSLKIKSKTKIKK